MSHQELAISHGIAKDVSENFIGHNTNVVGASLAIIMEHFVRHGITTLEDLNNAVLKLSDFRDETGNVGSVQIGIITHSSEGDINN